MRFAALSYFATCLAAGILLPAAAQAGDEHAVPQARIKSILESVVVPQYDGNKLLDVVGSYRVNGSGCQTSVEIAHPARIPGGHGETESFSIVEISWPTVAGLTQTGQEVAIDAPSFGATPRSFYAGSRAGELFIVMRRLGRLCGGLESMPPLLLQPTSPPNPAR